MPSRAGCRLAFGEDLVPVYHLERADVIVVARFRLPRAWARTLERRTRVRRAARGRRRRVRHHDEPAVRRRADLDPHRRRRRSPAGRGVARCRPVCTGHRRRAESGRTAAAESTNSRHGSPSTPAGSPRWHATWPPIGARVWSSPARRSRPEVHALAHLINHALGNVGKTVEFIARVDAGPADQIGSLRELVRDMNAGLVETLIILGGNPAYDAPADLDFAKVLASDKIKLRIHLGLYDDETAQLCHWHVPEAHCLESWSDLQAFDGTVSIQQPLIAPLYKGKSAHELLAVFLGEPDLSGLEIIRDYWRRGISRAISSRPGERLSRPG